MKNYRLLFRILLLLIVIGFLNEKDVYAEETNKTYTIQFDANGGRGSCPLAITVTGTNSNVSMGNIFANNTDCPIKNDYTFIGWSATETYSPYRISYNSISSPDGTSSTETGSTWSYADYCSNTGGDSSYDTLVLYAQWCKTIVLTYDTNGGDEAPASQTAYVYNSTSSYTFTLSDTIPTRDGYKFIGWHRNPSATVEDYRKSGDYAGGNYSTSCNTTLYGVWRSNSFTQTYTIQFDANGGSGPLPSTITKVGSEDTNLVMGDIDNVIPTKPGYTFIGWSATSSYSRDRISYHKIYAPNGTYSTETSGTWSYDNYCSYARWPDYNPTLTLYAQWYKTTSLNYNANGGSSGPSNQTVYLYNSDTSYTFTVSNITPKKSGYTFLGWSTNSAATTPDYLSGTSLNLSSSLTLYAVWSKNSSSGNTYTIRFDGNGANGGSLPPKLIADGSSSAVVMGDIAYVKPERSGYIFCGWSASTLYNYKNKRISYNTIYSPDGTNSKTTSASWSYANYCTYTGGNVANKTLILYAQWIKKITVNYNDTSNDLLSLSDEQTAYMHNEEANCTIRITDTIPFRDGYTFLGWSTSRTATVATYKTGTAYKFNSPVILYPVWKINPPTTTPSNKPFVPKPRARQIIYANDISTYQQTKAFKLKINARTLGPAILHYHSSNSKIKIKTDGTIQIPANYAGTFTITIKAVENSNYFTEYKTITVIIKKPSITLSKKSLTMAKGKSTTLKVKRTGISSKIKWISSNKKIVTVNSKGKLLAKKVGKAKITVTCGRLKKICNIKVVKKLPAKKAKSKK